MADAFNPVGWFEIPVKDLGRAMTFYEHVLKAKLEEHEMGAFHMAWFPMQEGAMGATGSLVQGESYEPSQGGVLIYLTTQDIDAALGRAADVGGEMLVPKTSIGEYGFVAYLKDSEGNRIGLHSRH
jgi:predicted enzyme related to lactoylglutathione lyase